MLFGIPTWLWFAIAALAMLVGVLVWRRAKRPRRAPKRLVDNEFAVPEQRQRPSRFIEDRPRPQSRHDEGHPLRGSGLYIDDSDAFGLDDHRELPYVDNHDNRDGQERSAYGWGQTQAPEVAARPEPEYPRHHENFGQRGGTHFSDAHHQPSGPEASGGASSPSPGGSQSE